MFARISAPPRTARVPAPPLAPLLLSLFAMQACGSEPDRSQEAAIEAIEKLGGEPTTRDGAVVRVSFRGTAITDDGLASLTSLPTLESLYLPGTAVGDVGLERLKGLPSLVNLYLSGTRVTDGGLPHIRGLGRLRVLALDRTCVSDAGLGHLKALVGLRHLDIRDTGVSEAGVEQLRRALPGCTILHRRGPVGCEAIRGDPDG